MKKPPHSPRQTKASDAWIPARPKTRGAEPASLGDVLVGAQEQLAQRGGNAIRRDEWRSIVGPRIAARTRVGRLYRGVLTVKVASSAWSNELSLLKSELLGKLGRAGHDISDLRFRVEEFEAPAQAKWRGQKRDPTHAQTLPDELEASLRKVDDPNLRAAIREAAKWSLSRNKPKGSSDV